MLTLRHPPRLEDSAQKLSLLQAVWSLEECVGNSDKEFLAINSGKMSGYRLGSVLRHNDCELYIDNKDARCKPCQRLRATLRGRARSDKEKKVSGHSRHSLIWHQPSPYDTGDC